jgi:hypothetical protein
LQASAVVALTRTTLPALADIAAPPVASGVGSGAPAEPPLIWTRKYLPGCTVTEGSTVTLPKLPVPVALAYCTDRPASGTGAAPRLYSST